MTEARSILTGQLWQQSPAVNFKLVRVLDSTTGGVVFQDVCGGPEERRAEYHFLDTYKFVVDDGVQVSLSGTGHRPEKLARFGPVHEIRGRVYPYLVRFLRGLGPARVISGMAPGFDQWLAWACVETGTPWYAAVPHAGQESRWSAAAQEEYRKLLSLAWAPPTILAPAYRPRSDGDPGTFELRDRWMVDYSNIAIACYLGYGGGTQNTIRYAVSRKRPILFIANPNLLP